MKIATRTQRRKPLTPAQQELAEQYLPLAKNLATRAKRAWPGLKEDFHSAAFLALVEAAESFDPSRGVKFATFAYYRIKGSLFDVRRRVYRRHRHIDMGRTPRIVSLTRGNEEQGHVLMTEPDPEIGTDLEAIEEVEHMLKGLPRKHAAACRQLYLHGKSQTEAARDLDCSQSRLSFMHHQALEMLNASWKDRLRESRRISA